jgi:rhodanese-related sulfurtransferase
MDGSKKRRSAAMKLNPARMSRNAKLGVLVCALGLIAAFAGSPYKGSKVTLDTAELADIVQREVDHVKPTELADWIIEGKSDYRLIDLRSEAEYNQYHIPGAENVPLAELADYGLARNEKIILYSEGGIHSAQAWFLLKAQGYKAIYMLLGGLYDWQDLVLFPSIPSEPSPEQHAAIEKMKQVSKFFGGSPQSEKGGEEKEPILSLPKPQLPVLPGGAPTASKRKKKEGC